jgi:hypothetical protein
MGDFNDNSKLNTKWQTHAKVKAILRIIFIIKNV